MIWVIDLIAHKCNYTELMIRINMGDIKNMRGLNNTFKYPVAKLLIAVTKNRGIHISDYEDAMGNYKKLLKKELEALLEAIKKGQNIDHSINLKQPESHIEEYDQAIAMLKMTSDIKIEINGNTFAQLVMDKWDWQHSFASNTKVFMGTSLRKPGAYSQVRA